MDNGYFLKPDTAMKLQRLLSRTGMQDYGYASDSPSILATLVTITGAAVDGLYPCQPKFWDESLNALEAADAGWLKELNDELLVVGESYCAFNTGTEEDGGYLYWTCKTFTPSGCYFEQQSDGTWQIDLGDLAGDGLTYEDDDSDSDSDSGYCPKLKVKEGCNVIVDTDGVHVDVDSLAGDGLTVEEDSDSGDCFKLAVLAGDCIIVDADGVHVDTEVDSTITIEVAGEPVLSREGDEIVITTPITTYEYGLNACGLVVSITDLGTVETTSSIYDDDDSDSDSDSGCVCDIDLGCGLAYDDDGKVAVDVGAITGTALIATIEGECTKIGVDLDTATTEELGPFITDIDFTIDGCTLTVNATRSSLIKHFNADGLQIDTTEGEPEDSEVSFSLDECCDDSDSGGDCGACVSLFGGELAMHGYTVTNIELGGTVVMGGSTDSFETHTIYSYNCVEGVCTAVLGITGAYPTLSACNDACGE